MAARDINTNFYLIGLTNSSDDGYAENSQQRLGGYAGRSQYCWESVISIDYSTIPSDATIKSVTIDVEIIDYNSGSNIVPLEVREQDKGSWKKVEGDQPRRTNPTFFDETTEFPAALSSVDIPVNGTGIFTIPSTDELVQLVQDQLDGTKNPANGIMITYYPEYYNYYLEIDSIQFTIEYESTNPTRRKVMIIS